MDGTFVYQSPDWVSADEAWGYPNRYIRDGFARQVQTSPTPSPRAGEPDVTGEDGLKAVEMVEAATRSAETGPRSDATVTRAPLPGARAAIRTVRFDTFH